MSCNTIDTPDTREYDQNKVELIVPSRTQRIMMDFAFRVAQEARDHVKIGAVIANYEGNILAYGYNGTPSGYSNEMRDMDGKTKECVIHAEENAIIKMARSPVSTYPVHAVMYSTIAPCIKCSAAIVQAGIIRVIFKDYYKTTEGIKLLSKCNVNVKRIKREHR